MSKIGLCSRLVLLVPILSVLVSCGANGGSPLQPSPGTGSSQATLPVAPINGRLAFVSTRDGSPYIYVGDASGVRRLASGDRPVWSPDGTQVAFSSRSGISVMNSDGTGIRSLGQGANPTWSPDASRIAFNDGNGSGIFVMNADGSDVRKVLDHMAVRSFSGFECGVYWPSWSRDGRHIAFVCALYEDAWTIHVMNADGSDPRRLIHNVGDSRPIWMPDGRIGFNSHYQVNVINVDGSSPRTVITNAFWSDWAADGRIAFTRQTGPGPTAAGGFETRIFAAVEGGPESRLIPDAVNPAAPRYGDFLPSWAP